MQKLVTGFVVLTCIALVESVSAQPITTRYVYPIRPGMSEWKNYRTMAQKLGVLQMPDTFLSRLTTEALIQSCLDYPFFFLYTAYNDSLGGMAHVIAGFNGLQELVRRNDSGSLYSSSIRSMIQEDTTPLGHSLKEENL